MILCNAERVNNVLMMFFGSVIDRRRRRTNARFYGSATYEKEKRKVGVLAVEAKLQVLNNI